MQRNMYLDSFHTFLLQKIFLQEPYSNVINKNAFQLDAYRPLQWPSDWGLSARGCLPRGCLPWGSAQGGVHPPVDRILDTRL